jgi:hypothetical protein
MKEQADFCDEYLQDSTGQPKTWPLETFLRLIQREDFYLWDYAEPLVAVGATDPKLYSFLVSDPHEITIEILTPADVKRLEKRCDELTSRIGAKRKTLFDDYCDNKCRSLSAYLHVLERQMSATAAA